MKSSLKNFQLLIIAVLVLLVTNFVSGHQIGDKVTCFKAPAPPTIDGKLNEWHAQTSITGYLTPDSDNVKGGGWGTTPPKDADDSSFEIFAMWDENNFYLAGEIVDNSVLLDNNPEAAPWRSAVDNIEVYGDPMNVGGGSRGVGLGLGIANGKVPTVFQSDPMEREALDYDAMVDVPKTSLRVGKTGWILEARLGKKAFDPSGIKLEPNHIFGVLFIIDDHDKNGEQHRLLCPANATTALSNAETFKLVFSAQLAPRSAAVFFQNNLTITWGQIKVAD
ncbi:hypothetical protein FJZ31_03880 [Candidatus Poribacteria bacterium]|nr:hypothetical protein [Candidatus Poribacteria bacterium]